MRSFTRSSFWDAYRLLPNHVKQQARNAYVLFQGNPNHPSLNLKRVGAGYRALGLMEQNDIIWFWIGPHQEYDRLLRRS